MLFDVLCHLVEPLLDRPDELSIDHIDTERADIFLISVPEGERGHLLGRNGRTADSLRRVMKRVGKMEDRDVVVDILD